MPLTVSWSCDEISPYRCRMRWSPRFSRFTMRRHTPNMSGMTMSPTTVRRTEMLSITMAKNTTWSVEVTNFAMFLVTSVRSSSTSPVSRAITCPALVRPKKRRSRSSTCS